MRSYANLLPALDRFLEATTAAQKWRVVRPLEARLQKDMRKAFTAQGAAFLDGFASQRGKFSEALTAADWLTIFDAAAQATYTLFLDPLEATAAAGLTAGANATMAALDVAGAFNLANPRAVQYINQHGAQNVRGINDTTRSYLQTVISQGVEEGWSYQRMAKAIKDRYREFAVGVPQQHIRSRAELVALTESAQAYEYGSAIPIYDLQSAGLTMEASWLTVGDSNVSDGCRENQAAGWIPFGTPFPSGDIHATRFPGCRCSTLYRRASG